jgi:hypothetical protein
MKITVVISRLFVFVALLNTLSAFAGTVIAGEGVTSCNGWATGSTSEHSRRMEWVLGFLSASNLSLKSELLNNTTGQGLEAIIDKYCAENPQQNLLAASVHAVSQLRNPKAAIPALTSPGNVTAADKPDKLDPTPNLSRLNPTCPSKATLKIDASGYSGMFVAELRQGHRPGSQRISGSVVSNGAANTFSNLCPGEYFFAFGPTDSDEVSVTRYFTVINDDRGYSNPVITVVYTRTTEPNSKLVQKARKKDL